MLTFTTKTSNLSMALSFLVKVTILAASSGESRMITSSDSVYNTFKSDSPDYKGTIKQLFGQPKITEVYNDKKNFPSIRPGKRDTLDSIIERVLQITEFRKRYELTIANMKNEPIQSFSKKSFPSLRPGKRGIQKDVISLTKRVNLPFIRPGKRGMSSFLLALELLNSANKLKIRNSWSVDVYGGR